jgi:hypothetical protein
MTSLPFQHQKLHVSEAQPGPYGACQSLARDADGPKTPCKPGVLQGEPRDGCSSEIDH